MRVSKPKKSLGQNFLTSHTVVNDIVRAAALNKSDVVLEVGPGKGILTEVLLKKADKVITIEKDRRLIPFLEEKFEEEIKEQRLKIIEGDILTYDIKKLGVQNGKYKLVANIPYYITGKFLQKTLTSNIQPSKVVLLLQKEVAQRIAREKKESILSISIKVYGTPKYIKTVPARYFKPRPKISSAIIAIENISKNNFKTIDEKSFFALVKQGFSQKRKKLLSNLKILADTKALEICFQELGIDSNARAEEISTKIWLTIAKKLNDKKICTRNTF